MIEQEQRAAWTARPWILAAVGGAIGLAIHVLLGSDEHWQVIEHPLRLTGVTILLVAGVLFGFTIERLRAGWAVAFALVVGLVCGGLFYWNGGPGTWEGPDGWRLFAALLAIAVAAPIFQVVRDAGRWALPYRALFDHAWTNVVMWCAGCAFVGIVWLLTFLLAALFGLIGIDFLQKLTGKAWFGLMLTGIAFGGAIGLLREQEGIVALIQRVVLSVLRVLAPVLGAGLVLFLAALPFTGLEPLWEATKSTTPILLVCVIGGLILANAVLGGAPEDEARLPPLRYGAMALGAAALPLAVIAAVSTSLRINQYGLTPDRLWAVVAVVVATVYGVAYLVALLRGRRDWAPLVRRSNITLALGTAALALFLATPLLGFGAISTRDQLARLSSGQISPERFDWAALAFDFGPAGRRALERMRANGSAAVRAKADEALAATDRWTLAERVRQAEAAPGLMEKLHIVPVRTPLPPALLDALTRHGQCGVKGGTEQCVVRHVAGEARAIFVQLPACVECPPIVTPMRRLPSGRWAAVNEDIVDQPADQAAMKARARRLAEAALRGEIEVRAVTRRQVFVGGEAMGLPFE